jgi:hypothetical protein
MADEWVYEDRRFTDSVVAGDTERLRALAKEYLYAYGGSAEFLLNVRENSLHRMTVRQIRGVLNWMRLDSRGRRILERGPKPEPEEPLWTKEICPQVRRHEEHYPHYFPLRSEPGSSKHCRGWHAMTREPVRVRARFHDGYVRGAKSNVIHRSTHVGWLTWYAEDWHAEGPSYPAHWTIGRACTPGAAPLHNAVPLDAAGVRAAEPVPVSPSVQPKEITLCRQCFPGTGGEVIRSSPFESTDVE